MRIMLAVAIGVLAAALVASVYSSSAAQYGFWEQHQGVRGVLSYLGFPTVYLLGLVGIDLTSSATPRIVAAFLQWLIVGYLLGGVFFREKGEDAVRASLRHD